MLEILCLWFVGSVIIGMLLGQAIAMLSQPCEEGSGEQKDCQ